MSASKKRRGKRALSPDKIAKAKRNRAELASLSRSVKAAMEMGMFPDCLRLNEALLEVYQGQTGQHDFRKFKEWKEDGYSVRKGEGAFRVWARPRKASETKEVKTPQGSDEVADAFEWFPICCLFHAGQVEDADGNAPPSCALFVIREMPLALPAAGESSASAHLGTEVAA